MKPFLTSSQSHSSSVMSGGIAGHLGGYHHLSGHHSINHLHHMTPNKRRRTVSADSGCDVNVELSETNPAILEETVRIWANRLETVLQQEVNQARQVSDASKQALYTADYDMRERVLRSWKEQILGIMDLTSDLIQCVNNDIKESLTDSAIHSPHEEEFSHFKEVETINEEDFKAFSTEDFTSTDDTYNKDDISSTEEVDAAIRDKLRHFLEDGQYIENFDYFDQASFETVSLSDTPEHETEYEPYDEPEHEPFKPLASSEHKVHAKRDLMPEFSFHKPARKSARRRIRKKLGFSRGYFTKAANNRFLKNKSIKKWIQGTQNQYKQLSNEPCQQSKDNTRKSSSRQQHMAKYKQSNNLLKTKKQIIGMIKKLKEMKIQQIRLSRGEDVFSSSKKRMFQSLLSQEDLFEEWRWTLENPEEVETIFAGWRWNLDEYEETEDIFKEWRWNLKEQAEVENIFKDWRKNLVEHENWNFWKDFGSIDDILGNTEEIMDEIRRMDDNDADWTKWKFWNKFGTVKEINHNSEAVLTEKKSIPEDYYIADQADKDWTQWPFWHSMGPVVSILYNTDSAKLASCPEIDEVSDDQKDDNVDNAKDSNNNMEQEGDNDDGIGEDDEVSTESGYSEEELNDGDTMDAHENWEAWKFWNEMGTAKEIIENSQDILVFGCFEDFIWVGNDDFLKDIGYLGGVVIGDVDDGCLGDCDDEYQSLLDGRVKKHFMRPNSPGKDSTCGCCPDFGSIKCRRTKAKHDKQEELMHKRHHDDVVKVCKALYTKQAKRKMSPSNEISEKIHVTDEFFDRHNIFKSLVVNAPDCLIFWDDSDREDVDDNCSCVQHATDDYWPTIWDDKQLIFWEDSSRDVDRDDDDLIHLDSADDLYIRRIINGDIKFQLFFDNYISTDDDIVDDGNDENKENEPWRAYKLMGPLWVDVNSADDGYCADIGSPPGILKIIRKKSSKRKPLSEISLVDVNEALWNIEKDCHKVSLKEELANLPFWESPDVFGDACEQIESSNLPTVASALPAYTLRVRAKEPINTFRTWRFLFTEPSKYRNRVHASRRNCRKHCSKKHEQKTNDDLDIEDVFKDWSSWALLEPVVERLKWIVAAKAVQEVEADYLRKLEIERILRGRKLARNSDRKREVNKKKSKRPDSPTVAYTMLNKHQLQAEQSWISTQNSHHTWGKRSPARPNKRSGKPVQKQVAGRNSRIFQPQTRCTSSGRRI